MEEAPSPRFLGTHMHPDNIPTSFYEKKTKVSKAILLKSSSTGAVKELLMASICCASLLRFSAAHQLNSYQFYGLFLVLQMLVIFRNPKDTLVSFYHFCNNNPVLPAGKSWDSFYSDFMRGDGG